MKEELNKSLTIAGIVLLINSLGMVVGNLLGGVLFDKLGGYKTILIGTFTCLISTTLLNIFHGWPWYAVWLVLLGFGGGMIIPQFMQWLEQYGRMEEDKRLMLSI